MDRPKPGDEKDAGTSEVLLPPAIEAMPDRTPLTTVKAQGTTDGSRIVTQGSPAGTLVTVVLPGGSFCQDTPLATDGPTTVRYYSLAGDGRVSTAVERTITYDPAAAAPPLPTCSGEDPPNCAAEETCGNDEDENCNGWTDECDTACNGCEDDAFEPNDFPANVPSLTAGTYQMKLCPCRDDWFAFNVNMGTRIHATIDFDSSLIDIDVRLYRAGPEGNGISEQVAASAGTDSQEEIDWVADMPGAYYMRVFPFRDEDMPQGSYSLRID